ncbi:MAG: hypothetical protein JEY91_08035 [Spirochaetaceae bacterium]|nr:hypothetical protein [Spirochaetaceae bacterium]
MKTIPKSFLISLFLIIILIATRFVLIPWSNIIVIADGLFLLILSVLQALESIRFKKILAETSDILSQGNERDFSVLQSKEKNIINHKIFNLIEQLEDSVKQSDTMFDEKEKLAGEVENYRKLFENIQNSLNRQVIDIKNPIAEYNDVLEGLLSDFKILLESLDKEEKSIDSLFGTYAGNEENSDAINQSIEETKAISNREINRSELLIEKISSLSDKADNSDEQLSVIFKGIDNIREVTDIINDVAEKASILSLNAAIESAHAGEAGKGFAVVAEEVGVLADSTAEHAENINKALYSVTDLINENIQSEEQELNSYPELLHDAREIHKAFHTITELLSTLSNMKKPDQMNIQQIRTIDRSKDIKTISEGIKILSHIKKEMEQSIEKVGRLAILQRETVIKKEPGPKRKIHETSVKPVHPETPMDFDN